MKETIEILKKYGLFPMQPIQHITAGELAEQLKEQYCLEGEALRACIGEGIMPQVEREEVITEELLADIIVRLLAG